jgi:hypothetical protein
VNTQLFSNAAVAAGDHPEHIIAELEALGLIYRMQQEVIDVAQFNPEVNQSLSIKLMAANEFKRPDIFPAYFSSPNSGQKKIYVAIHAGIKNNDDRAGKIFVSDSTKTANSFLIDAIRYDWAATKRPIMGIAAGQVLQRRL